MLEIIKVKKRTDIGAYFSSFDAQNDTWLVSDLRTKIELQNRLVERDSFFVEDTVLRATDMWEILFFREFFGKKSISREWARILLSNFLKKHEGSLNLNKATSGTLLEMIDFFIPILAHPEGHEQFGHWLENNLEFKERWADWYLLSRLCYQFLFVENNLVLPSWYSALLLHKGAALSSWKKPLWVDLGGQILWAEAEVLRNLSRYSDVRVFCVEAEWQKDYSYKMRPYTHLQAQAQRTQVAPITERPSKTVHVQKFSGELAEIRQAVWQVRTWLESGVAASEIGILAPDIEKYWPVLKEFLSQEGLPANKDSVARLSSWPSVQESMAYLRIHLKEVRTSNIEAHYFQQVRPKISYEDFKSLYTHLLTRDDLERHPEIFKIYSAPLKISATPLRDEWIAFLSKTWPIDKNTKPLALILEELFFKCPSTLRLPLSDWLEQLESLVSRKEVVLSPADKEGIHLASLLAAPSLWLKKRIFLGLSEDALKQGGSQFISRFEVEKLYADLGFYLENHELSAKEFELRLLADCDSSEDVFSFGAVTLSGQLQAPAGFFLQIGQAESLKAPKATRWDEIQTLGPQRYDGPLMRRLSLDRGEELLDNFSALDFGSLSASRIESYLDCPFKFAAESLFKLQDNVELDLNVHPRDYGNFVHDLFERLSLEMQKKDFKVSEIDNLLQELFENGHNRSFHPELWPAFKKKLAILALRFIEFEKEWKNKFPKTKILSREKKWSFEIAVVDGKLQLRPGEKAADGSFLLRGKIDRIDGDGEGNLVVLDYKSGVSSALNYSKWYEKNKLQLLFYIWALENSLKLIKDEELADGAEVVGAFYYVFKNMERNRGIGLVEKGSNLFPTEGGGALTDQQTKQALLIDLEKTITEVVQNIKSGIFQPRPREEDLCKPCRWKKLCRAPHLK